MELSSGKGDCLCPFFRSKGEKSICCEGFTDGNSVSVRYCSRKELEVQWDCFCCGRYENCEIYRMVMGAKYDE